MLHYTGLERLAMDKQFGLLGKFQCDQIGRNFAIWLLFTWPFSIFNLNKQSQRMICETYFTFQKQFDATIILSFDNLAAILATFPKIGWFFSNFWSLWPIQKLCRKWSVVNIAPGAVFTTCLFLSNLWMGLISYCSYTLG